jgi:hypothetical protein
MQLELCGAIGANSLPVRMSVSATRAMIECVACAVQVEIADLTRQLQQLRVSIA